MFGNPYDLKPAALRAKGGLRHAQNPIKHSIEGDVLVGIISSFGQKSIKCPI
jgi:hypothetical protein